MYQVQRLEKIMEILDKKNQVTAKEIVKLLGVSRDTIRRDFLILEKREDVQRTHGGLVKIEENSYIKSYKERKANLSSEKEQIAYKAKKMIKNEGLYFFSASTITEKLSQIVESEVTIYSHSLDIATVVSVKENINFYLLGGKFFPKQRFFHGNNTDILDCISFDIAFIGAAGAKNGKVMLDDYEDVEIKRKVMENAKTKVLLAENSKFEKEAHYILGKITDFDYWITDEKPNEEILKLLKNKVEVIY